MRELFTKIDELVDLLVSRSNPSADFFKNEKQNLEKNSKDITGLDNLIKCYAITQYANFSKKEEDVLIQIINIARDIKGEIIKKL